MGAIYKESTNNNKFVVSNKALFPKYNLLMKNTGGEHALLKSVADKEPVEILQDHELHTLWDKVDFNNDFETQRWNILVLGYRTAYRGECLQRLQVESFKKSQASDGSKVLTCVLGTMKNHQAGLNKVDMALLKQQITQCADPRFCAIEAYERQCKLSRPPVDAEFGGQDYLFRTCLGPAAPLGTTPTSENTYRGVYKWVRTIIKRDVTFKDLARRVCLTKLANHPDISDDDISKYIKISKKTVATYHRLNSNKKDLAAKVLSEHAPKVEAPKVEAPKVEAPKVEAPKVEVKAEAITLSPPTMDDFGDFDSAAGNQKGMAIDVDDWGTINLDHEDFPPSQLSQVLPVKEQLQRQKRTYKKRAFAAPATPAGAPISQDLTSLPSPFSHKKAKPNGPAASSSSSSSATSAMCYKCDQPLPAGRDSRALLPVTCDVCRATYHLKCTGRTCMPRHGWACEGCKIAMNA